MSSSDPINSNSRPNSRLAKWAIVLLVMGFVWYAMLISRSKQDTDHWARNIVMPWVGVLLLGLVFQNKGRCEKYCTRLDRLKNPSRKTTLATTFIVFLISVGYFYLSALYARRDFSLRVQDEMMYLVQTQSIARGQLYQPAHPMSEFFQTFYIFTKPVYSSMYFPGAAMMFSLSVWLHIPIWLLTLLITSAVVAFTCQLVTELTDDLSWGLIAALLVLGIPTIRKLSLMAVSYMPMALLGVLLLLAFLRWSKARKTSGKIIYAAIIGLLSGWAAITRPLDAVTFVLPIAVAMVLSTIQRKSSDDFLKTSWPQLLISSFMATLFALPFLAMQFKLNHAITGRWLENPIEAYEKEFWPGTKSIGGGKHAMKADQIDTVITQHNWHPKFADNYREFVLSHFNGSRPKPRPWIQLYEWALPRSMLILLIPVAWIGLLCTNQKSNLSPASITLGRIVMAILILFPSAYLIWVMFLPYYAVVASPILICAVILGARQLPVCFPLYQNSLRAWISSCIVLVGVLSMTFLTKRNEVIKNESTSSAVISKFNELAKTIHQPAVVFFTYPADERGAWKHEQVYNFEAANIDDQLIIRANDLGDKNQKLIDYYASRQPRRVFYKFDQKMLELTEMK